MAMSFDGFSIVTQVDFDNFLQPDWSMIYDYKINPHTGKYESMLTGFGKMQSNGHVKVQAIISRPIDANGVWGKSCLYLIKREGCEPEEVIEVLV